MHTLDRFRSSALLGVCLLLAPALACESKKEELPPGASPASEIGRPLADLELPVSLRNSDPAPSNAHKAEATSEQLRLNGEVVVALERGRVPEAEQKDGTIPKLAAKLSASSRSTLAMRLQANLPYETAALMLNTAKKAGMSNAAFEVRGVGESTTTGWLAVNNFIMSSKAEALPLQNPKPLSWNAFTDKWDAIFEGCRTDPSGNCAYVNENVAEGGTLRIELHASGRGVNVNFFRRGLSREQEAEEEKKRAQQLAAKKEDFLQGRITKDDMVEALLLGHPSTYALFQFRYGSALKHPSALTKTIAPVCHQVPCGVIVTADKVTNLLNVVSLMGAAFPNTIPMPAVSFEMPWTEKPKPADLAEFIETQQNL